MGRKPLYTHTEETKQQIAAKCRVISENQWKNPTIRRRRVAGLKRVMAKPETREHIAAGMRAYWARVRAEAEQNGTA